MLASLAYDSFTYGETGEPILANAHLIAAAPDLYAALKALVASCTSPEGAIGPEPNCRREWLQCMVDAKEALAKADGRSDGTAPTEIKK